MREALWPEAESASHAREIDEFFAGKLSMPLAALIALDDRKPVGFAELSIRNYAEDCVTDRVAYLEGWYVIPRSEEHTSELQSRSDLVCRLLLEKKKNKAKRGSAISVCMLGAEHDARRTTSRVPTRLSGRS